MTTTVIRVDADRAMGLGHVERMWNLAATLAASRYRPVFVTREQGLAAERLKARGAQDVITFPGREDAAAAVEAEADAIHSASPGLVIFDTGSTSHDLVASVKSFGAIVVSFEDLGDGRYLADLVVDANLTSSTNPRKLETTTRYLLGPEYAVIAPAVRAARRLKRAWKEVKKILVSCGGSDPAGVTPRVVEGLADLDTDVDVEVVLGPAFAHGERLNEALLSSARTFSIVEAPDDLPARMRKAQVGILSGGVTLYEAAHLGLPSIVIAQNPAQLRNLPPFESRGGIVNLGLASNLAGVHITPEVRALMDPAKRKSMSKALEEYVDGRGADRILAAIKEVQGR